VRHVLRTWLLSPLSTMASYELIDVESAPSSSLCQELHGFPCMTT
jgi:hypothetical protein